MNFADETWVHCPVTKNKNKPECTFSSLSGKMEASRIAFWTQYFHIARSKHNRVQEHLFRYSGYVRGLIIWLHMPPSQKSFSPIFFFFEVQNVWPLMYTAFDRYWFNMYSAIHQFSQNVNTAISSPTLPDPHCGEWDTTLYNYYYIFRLLYYYYYYYINYYMKTYNGWHNYCYMNHFLNQVS